MKVTEFIKQDGNIVLNVPYAEAYIPSSLMGDPEKGNPTAYKYGDGICTVGVLNMRFYDTPEPKNRDSAKLRTLNYPNMIIMYPDNIETMTLQLSEDMEPDKYHVLQFNKGDIIMSAKNQMKSTNCESFMNLLIRGKLPKGIKYDDLYYAWEKNFRINNVNPGVPAITLQIIISENCRSYDNPEKQFRKVVNDENVSLTDYRVYNMVNICSRSSVMNALTFEHFKTMLSYSLNMSKSDTPQNTTPLEEVLYM